MKPTVFYVEKQTCPELHEHILKHLPRMQNWYEWEGCELVYLPLYQLDSVEWESVHGYLEYRFPVLKKPEFAQVLGTLKEPTYMLVNRILVQNNLQEAEGQAFLLYTDETLQNSTQSYRILSSYIRQESSVEEFFAKGFQNLWDFRSRASHSLIFKNLNVNLSLRNKLVEFEESALPEETSTLSLEIRARLDALREIGDKSAMMDVLVHLLNNMNPYIKADKAAVIKMLEKHWKKYAIAQQPSRLLIDKHVRIFLPDFGNLEVQMSPLPKTVFLFYLLHPEGVSFPYLIDHRKELEQIYSKITNQSDPDKIKRSIDDLVDPTTNRISEKCSRANAAFLLVMDESVAKHYLVSGPRGGIKNISLDRSLVIYDLPATASLQKLT